MLTCFKQRCLHCSLFFSGDVEYLAQGLTESAAGYVDEHAMAGKLENVVPGASQEARKAAIQTTRFVSVYILQCRGIHFIEEHN